MSTMFLTVFYGPVIPFGFLLSTIGIFMVYKIEKFIILNVVQIRTQLNR